ncbi:hypothetical protein [Amycolatopsis sp. DSM 110486]|uniref:hypothetical protein n=1 Tax=Amycolatopsis sp. DSM 110486 TaxID=2865832 RepID=UPI001C6A67C7|nr:hypothetical protein [Amycolatopsis sp. DSM 110486]QYN17501.1 hypothetical protein K1T34_32465 [Amycolatopsis sp. DSM 110486]
MTVLANQQHTLDNATGKWTRVAKGVYENFDGRQIRKVNPNRSLWAIFDTDHTTQLSPTNPRQAWQSLIIAKYEADLLPQPTTTA